uniref:Histone-lysine N-methyltransferase n=1 Tax=Populus davidiana TaxID=266767 RepID=A0A6M2ETL7_9ROSI
MEESPGEGSIDKSRVLNVKPLRTLTPVFSAPPNSNSFPQGSAPFVCVPPAGPFPPGVSPFFPFSGIPNQSVPSGDHTPISSAVPINSFRSAEPPSARAANGNAGSSRRANRNNRVVEEDGYGDIQTWSSQSISQKRTKGKKDKIASPDVDMDVMVENIYQSYNLVEFEEARRYNGDKDSVGCVLLVYNLLRRQIVQLEDSKEATAGQSRRPDLKAGNVLMTKGVRTNAKKRVGAVPGVEIGDIFFFRMELCTIGLHAPIMAGIDYMSVKVSQDEEPIAVSIVSSGGYEDDVEEDDGLIYSGQGKEMDQKLERGNLALEKSLHRGNDIRVTRGIKDVGNPTGKVYVYDGLYRIQESWVEKGKSGSNVFRYKLGRLPGQPDAYKMWKKIQQWKDGIIPRMGIILPDLTSGAETLPVSLVNDVDHEKGPAYFNYSPTLKYSKPVPRDPFVGCACNGACLPGNENCDCVQKNGGYLPHIVNGVIVSQKSVIYECGPPCQCPPTCRNRVSQGGLRLRLEVFKTKDRGWGLRSWDPIRAGAFICVYAGEAVDDSEAQELAGENEDDHIFYGTRIYQPLEVLPGDLNNAPNLQFPLIINARNAGNVARFINHSCSPNLFWQPVLRGNSKEFDLHIAFYAIRHIPPMTELTYCYGMVPPEKADCGKRKCLCGSPKCRGFFY